MSGVLEQRTTAFVEAEERFPFQETAASAFAEDLPEYGPRGISSSEADWIRSIIMALSRRVKQLHQDVPLVVREIPRFQQFRRDFQQFLRSNYRKRAAQRQAIADYIGKSSVPSIYIQEVLRQCSTGGAPDGLDIGIDLLTGFNTSLVEAFDTFTNRDRGRWGLASPSNPVNDDVCYVLLRALARSSLPISEKLPRIAECLNSGTASIREAATHALGDLGGDRAKELLGKAINADPDSLVRESAREALDDFNS